ATIPPLEIGVPRRLVPHYHDIAHDRQGVPTPRWVRALLICLLGVSRGGVAEGSERWEPIGTGRASGEDDVLVAHLHGQIWLLKLARHLARGGSAREDMNVLE